MVVIPTSEHVSLHYGRTPDRPASRSSSPCSASPASSGSLARPPLAFPAPKERPQPDARRRRAASRGGSTWDNVEWDTLGGVGQPRGRLVGRRATGTGRAPRRTGDHVAHLDAIFKAYDIRGTVPDQLDATIARAIGTAFARFAAAPRVLIAHDMRESGPELAAAFAEGVRREGVDVVHARARLDRHDLLRRRPARRARGDAHRVAQPRRVQRHQAVPRPAPGPSASTAASPRSRQTTAALLADGDTRPAAWHRDDASTCSTTSSPTSTRSSTSARSAR